MVKKRFFKTKQEVEVSFEVNLEDVRQVALVCEANDWEPIEMKRNKSGAFRTRLRLPRERQFQFRYLVDESSWVNDEDADGFRPNKFGGEDGVLDTTPAS